MKKQTFVCLSVLISMLVIFVGCKKDHLVSNEDSISNSNSHYSEKIKIYDEKQELYLELTLSSNDITELEEMGKQYEDLELVVVYSPKEENFIQPNESLLSAFGEEDQSTNNIDMENLEENQENLIISNIDINVENLLKRKKDNESMYFYFVNKKQKSYAWSLPIPVSGRGNKSISMTGGSAAAIYIKNNTTYWLLSCLCNRNQLNWKIDGTKGNKVLGTSYSKDEAVFYQNHSQHGSVSGATNKALFCSVYCPGTSCEQISGAMFWPGTDLSSTLKIDVSVILYFL